MLWRACALRGTGVRSAREPPPHRQRCASVPAPSLPLPTFLQVRVKGEEVYDTRAILIDTTPPVTTISNTTLDLSAGFTSSDTADFSFYATDEGTNTRFFCTLTVTNAAGPAALGMLIPPDPDNPGAGTRVQAVTSGQQFNCSSPAQLVGLSFGNYSFQVRGAGGGVVEGARVSVKDCLKDRAMLHRWRLLLLSVGAQLATLMAALSQLWEEVLVCE